MGLFPGGWERRHWLAERLDAIMGRERPTRTRKPAVSPLPFRAAPIVPCRPNPPHRRQHKHGRRRSTLERLQVDIPLVVDSDLRPLLAALFAKTETRFRQLLFRKRQFDHPPRCRHSNVSPDRRITEKILCGWTAA